MKNIVLIEDIKNSKVIVRVNYDLPSLKNPERIIDSLKSIKLLLNNGNKLLIITHWKRPREYDNSLSTQNMVSLIDQVFESNKILSKILFIKSIKDLNFEFSNTNILDNIRFDPRESSKDETVMFELANEIAQGFDYFVDEAFPLSHRKTATNYSIKKILPFAFGVSYLDEESKISQLIENTGEFHVIVGGAKMETKLDLINSIIEHCDRIYIGGLLCFTFLEAKGIRVNSNLSEKNFLDIATDLLQKYPHKIYLPTDFNLDQNKNPLDIGSLTVRDWSQKLKTAKRIFWNGPLGKTELEEFSKGTVFIANAVIDSRAYSVIGGGDTVASLNADLIKSFNFVSMGGGATLNYLVQILNKKSHKNLN
jgi:phosphoglycerate kinase